jgi:diacylglycerol kinase (ATP)
MSNNFQQIQVIINPAAGQNEQILNTLNQVFQKYEIDWQVAITQNPGDASRLVKEAVAAGADLVAGYGGDGTLMEIVNGLRGSQLPLGILPGGTGNGLARKLNIPLDLAQAAELLCQAPAVRQIDVGRVNDRYFLLHVYSGLRPSQRASRDLKDNLGMLAYLLPVLRVIKEPQISHYSLTIDGEEVEQEGIFCGIMNTSGLDIDLPLTNIINPKAGLLDLFLIKKDVPAAMSSLLELKITDEILQHWQGREISVHSDPSQNFWIDGESGGQTPFTAVIVPQALHIIAPQKKETNR